MRNVRLLIAYDGSRFFGWQRQEGFGSVQQAVEEGLESLLGDRVVVHGAGRTDTGVHALGQVASCHVDTSLDDQRLCHALNAHLDEGVVVRRVETCPDDFHARFSATGKRYLYLTVTTPFRPPFAEGQFHWTREPLDQAAMRDAASRFLGQRDFAALASSGSPRTSTVRTVEHVRLVARRDRFAIVVQGNGFLYNMVRTIAGTLIDVGRGRLVPSDVDAILASGDRRRAGATAPAGGLWLLRVRYPERCFTGRLAGPRGAAGLFQG
ncbi:tRNA pseudouridine(38-40) synthase TruA [Engelhardtia mirabilis]|uniref:tRNA pseudouridine synthase A n=1 Tax=Engelhardtia mirabilis TaxID=2528011 RepID=A0A518BPC2_9BACT|nr:tRNA pseudouridine synthase A [Planctomycetes bacterium Pla133]QDV03133.1 tRNA pseudouridine synthase A [Planctomycetes bacterium Pla86]